MCVCARERERERDARDDATNGEGGTDGAWMNQRALSLLEHCGQVGETGTSLFLDASLHQCECARDKTQLPRRVHHAVDALRCRVERAAGSDLALRHGRVRPGGYFFFGINTILWATYVRKGAGGKGRSKSECGVLSSGEWHSARGHGVRYGVRDAQQGRAQGISRQIRQRRRRRCLSRLPGGASEEAQEAQDQGGEWASSHRRRPGLALDWLRQAGDLRRGGG